MSTIDPKELEQFLHDANKSTYANKDAPKAPPTRLRSEDYHFKQGDLIYHDTYFGTRDFIGEEIVYNDNTPVWGTNYYGYILIPSMSKGGVYSFLREALMQKYVDVVPVRGPMEYEHKDWRYMNKIDGDLSRFTGREQIYLKEKLVYQANYHGGFIA